jgi:hypothetical protein
MILFSRITAHRATHPRYLPLFLFSFHLLGDAVGFMEPCIFTVQTYKTPHSVAFGGFLS